MGKKQTRTGVALTTFLGFVDAQGKFALDFPEQFKAFVARWREQEVELLIRKRRTIRSTRQNAALHACLDRWAKDKGHDVEQLKDDLLALCWGYVVTQNLFTGEVVKRLVKPHTSKLSTAEFTQLFDVAAVEAAKDGHVMTMPDEFKANREKKRKAA